MAVSKDKGKHTRAAHEVLARLSEGLTLEPWLAPYHEQCEDGMSTAFCVNFVELSYARTFKLPSDSALRNEVIDAIRASCGSDKYTEAVRAHENGIAQRKAAQIARFKELDDQRDRRAKAQLGIYHS